MWEVKQRYGGNADVARAAALLALAADGLTPCGSEVSETTGETTYLMKTGDGQVLKATAREIAYAAHRALIWFDFPYGDPGEPEQKDDKGNVVRERRKAVSGYVGPMKDALCLPEETVSVGRRVFSLPQVACANLTWQQYRSLQGIAPQLFAEGVGEDDAVRMQSQFLAHILVPRSLALLDTDGGSIRLRLHWEYRYNMPQADGLARWFERRMRKDASVATLFHVCFQTYQTALTYYSRSFPQLFSGEGKADPLRDALTGEAGTINTVMKYAGYSDQQQVYDSFLPFVLDILNMMTKEAKEIEKMNSRIKKK
jgi:hypothetical protein